VLMVVMTSMLMTRMVVLVQVMHPAEPAPGSGSAQPGRDLTGRQEGDDGARTAATCSAHT
jgi:hypothetical protein